VDAKEPRFPGDRSRWFTLRGARCGYRYRVLLPTMSVIFMSSGLFGGIRDLSGPNIARLDRRWLAAGPGGRGLPQVARRAAEAIIGVRMDESLDTPDIAFRFIGRGEALS